MTHPLKAVLLHADGPDCQSVASYMERRGYAVVVCSVAAEVPSPASAPDAVYLLHQECLAGVASGRLDELRLAHTVLIVPPGVAVMPGFSSIREPYFLDQLVKKIEDGAPAPLPAVPAAVATPAGVPPAAPLLGRIDALRGIAHAINNHATVALGWARLLDAGTADPAVTRAAEQIRGVMDRLVRTAQALSVIGGRAARHNGALDLAAVVAAAAARSPHVKTSAALTPPALVNGDMVEFDLFVSLLLEATVEPAMAGCVEARVDAMPDHVELVVTDHQTRASGPAPLDDLGALLGALPHARAFGLATAAVVVGRLNGTISTQPQGAQGVVIRVRLPAYRRPPGNHPAP